MLHEQERKLAKKPRGWRDYYLATQSDTGVASFWRWLDTFAGMPGLLCQVVICLLMSCLWVHTRRCCELAGFQIGISFPPGCRLPMLPASTGLP